MAIDFNVPLSRPLPLENGHALLTLADAVSLMGELPEFPNLRPV